MTIMNFAALVTVLVLSTANTFAMENLAKEKNDLQPTLAQELETMSAGFKATYDRTVDYFKKNDAADLKEVIDSVRREFNTWSDEITNCFLAKLSEKNGLVPESSISFLKTELRSMKDGFTSILKETSDYQQENDIARLKAIICKYRNYLDTWDSARVGTMTSVLEEAKSGFMF